jgi:exo-1,4-beta-D-glucosaminidase
MITCSTEGEKEGTTSVTIANRSPSVASFIRVRLTHGDNDHDVLPVRWTDDYITLMPGERRTLTARYRLTDLDGEAPALVVGGWNMREETIAGMDACG